MAGCDPPMPGYTCYDSHNDVPGLTVDSVSIDRSYTIDGDGITLGAGGLTVSAGSAPSLLLPVTLGASQTWTMGGMTPSIPGASPTVGAITGAGDSLNIDFGQEASVTADGDIEVGPLSFTGAGSLRLFNGTASPGGAIANVNASDSQHVTFGAGAGLMTETAHTNLGPLSTGGGAYISLGTGAIGAGVDPTPTLSVNGPATLGPDSTLTMYIDEPSADPTGYSRMTATGNVALGGTLDLLQSGLVLNGPCPDLNPGDVYTLISTSGTLSGTFAGDANGATVSIGEACPSALGPATGFLSYGRSVVRQDGVRFTRCLGGRAHRVHVSVGEVQRLGWRLQSDQRCDRLEAPSDALGRRTHHRRPSYGQERHGHESSRYIGRRRDHRACDEGADPCGVGEDPEADGEERDVPADHQELWLHVLVCGARRRQAHADLVSELQAQDRRRRRRRGEAGRCRSGQVQARAHSRRPEAAQACDQAAHRGDRKLRPDRRSKCRPRE